MGRVRSRSEAKVTDDEHAPGDADIAKLPGLEASRFGAHVRRLRRARGVTQEVLAERCKLAADTIRRLEHGCFSPSLDTLTKLCAGLQIARSTLFESYELGESDLTREVVDLLLTRSPREIELALRMLRSLFGDIDALAHDPAPVHINDVDDERAE
jgi:transcriptional regulator with XRE-family HTH domain